MRKRQGGREREREDELKGGREEERERVLVRRGKKEGKKMARVGRIKLGSQGLEVSAQGLGCMAMSGGYGPPKPEPDMISLIHHALQSGITFLDTSDIYGPFTNELLLGKVSPLFSVHIFSIGSCSFHLFFLSFCCFSIWVPLFLSYLSIIFSSGFHFF